MRLILGVNYMEPDPKTYAGFEVRSDGETLMTFNTGNPTVDFLTAMWWIMLTYGENVHMSNSSSVDHFAMDGGDLRDADGQYTKDEVRQAQEIACRITGKEIPKVRLKDEILAAFEHLDANIVMLEDGADIAATLDAIRKGDGEGTMIAGGKKTVIKMGKAERELRNALCRYLEDNISSKAKAAYAAYKDK